MGLTLCEKIIKSHLVDGEYKKGNEVGIRIDQTLTQDATGTMAYLELEVFVKNAVFVTLVQVMVFVTRYI